MAGVRNISPYDVWRGAIQALVFMHANEIHDQTQASLEEEMLRLCLLLHKTAVCVRDGLPRLQCLLVNYSFLIPLKWHS